jgi:hypothetical protein
MISIQRIEPSYCYSSIKHKMIFYVDKTYRNLPLKTSKLDCTMYCLGEHRQYVQNKNDLIRRQLVLWKLHLIPCDWWCCYWSRLVVHHILSRPDVNWTSETGHIRADLLQRLLPPLSTNDDPMRTLVCICGPTAFTKLTIKFVLVVNYAIESFVGIDLFVSSLLNEQGYNDKHLHAFLAWIRIRCCLHAFRIRTRRCEKHSKIISTRKINKWQDMDSFGFYSCP